MRVATVRRCARPGLFRTPSRSEDLLRAAAIKQRAQKTPVVWLGVCTPKQFRRTCTSVSPFFAMTERRLGVRTSHHKFMHSPKSCGKNPKSTSTIILPIGFSGCCSELASLAFSIRIVPRADIMNPTVKPDARPLQSVMHHITIMP